MMRQSIQSITALFALIGTTGAQAAEAERCITRTEMRSMVAYVMPAALGPVIESCKSKLAPDAYLSTGGLELQKVLKADQDATWPAAKAAFSKAFMPEGMRSVELPDTEMRTMLEAKLGEEIGGKIGAETCQDISNVAARMAPLSAANMIDLVTEIAVVALRNSKKRPVSICKA